MFDLNVTAWFYLFMLVLFSTVIPSFMMAEAIHRIGPAHTSITGILGPVFTILLAVYLLNEPFNLFTAIGGILVISGIIPLIRGYQ